jgi:hypothetical protein
MAKAARGLTVHRFAGVALGGGKTDRTSVAVLEYYPEKSRVFLRVLRDRVKGESGVSSDQALVDLLTLEEPVLESIALDAPLQLPKCIRCTLVCPGFEVCRLPEIRWLWNEHESRESRKRPNKTFTPYTERCAEVFIANHLSLVLEEPFHPPHALGSNAAPLAARAHYLLRRITGKEEPRLGTTLKVAALKARPTKVSKTTLRTTKSTSRTKQVPQHPRFLEVFPKLSVWQIGRDLRMPKSHLRFHRHAVDSDEARHYFIKTLIEREIAFVYQQDLRTLVESPQAFDAFVCAMTAYLEYRGQTAPRPSGFPPEEIWITYPQERIDWGV